MVSQIVAAFVEKNAPKDMKDMIPQASVGYGGSRMWRLLHAIDEKARIGSAPYLTKEDIEKEIRAEEMEGRFNDIHTRLSEIHDVVLELARKSTQPLDVAQTELGNQ